MSEVHQTSGVSAERSGASPSPGALLRSVRERQGVHLGVLAIALKVSPRKLELLEDDRFDELPDATFVRALALAVCRALKTDPTEVMAAYAALDVAADPFKDVGKGLNEPMRASARGSVLPTETPLRALNARTWLLLALLLSVVLSVVVWWVGSAWSVGQALAPEVPTLAPRADTPTVESPRPLVLGSTDPGAVVVPLPASSSSSADALARQLPSPALVAQGSSATSTLALAASAPASPPVASSVAADVAAVTAKPEAALTVSVSADSWLEVVDASRRVVWSQVVPEGESVQLSARPPLQIVIGNAQATRLALDGQSIDLAAHVRGNVARLQVP